MPYPMGSTPTHITQKVRSQNLCRFHTCAGMSPLPALYLVSALMLLTSSLCTILEEHIPLGRAPVICQGCFPERDSNESLSSCQYFLKVENKYHLLQKDLSMYIPQERCFRRGWNLLERVPVRLQHSKPNRESSRMNKEFPVSLE